MAFFRCGGSGIPASLKSGMNSVLNKKFGTSTTYDPAGWPADVNLLGPLPVKSASGAIASFADGADGVPVKSCTVSFLPSGGGGTPSAPVAIVGHSGITLTNKDNMSTPTHTDTYTDTFGQTIYGGTRDLTTDKASVTWGIKTFNGSNDEIWTLSQSAGVFRYALNYLDDAKIDHTGRDYVIANIGVYSNSANTEGTCFRYSGSGTVCQLFYIPPQDNDTVEKFKTWLSTNNLTVCYPLATPTEITGLTPHAIDTLYGDNNIYADTGTTTVEYRADIDLALNA